MEIFREEHLKTENIQTLLNFNENEKWILLNASKCLLKLF